MIRFLKALFLVRRRRPTFKKFLKTKFDDNLFNNDNNRLKNHLNISFEEELIVFKKKHLFSQQLVNNRIL